jgi:L-alanine-DL-glutamate epimerase-like enolase superfamily enzyme
MTTFTLESIQFHVLPMRTRFPFKYGIASLSSLPHLFVTATLVVNGKAMEGLASEGLAPKWFTKDPTTTPEQDVAEMLSVVQNAARIGRNVGRGEVTFFQWWKSLYDEQALWAQHRELPMLLANLGTSLIERAVLDALCKALGLPLHRLLKTDELAIDLGAVRDELSGMKVADVTAPEPVMQVHVRHTIGLADPLSAADVTEVERVNDGLPYSLDENIRAYGLSYFKIKVSGKADADIARLREIAVVLDGCCKEPYRCTLDGNEQFHDIAAFQDFYRTLASDPALKRLFASLIMIEQPIYRGQALDESVGEGLRGWSDGLPMIIDESDGSLSDLPRALSLGYQGTSHKNCKGVMKGIANAALLKRRGLPWLSGEDLASVGPVATLQDLCVASLLGITHVERNGHHYFRGLSMYDAKVQADVLSAHKGFYRQHVAGFPTLDIRAGKLDVTTLHAAPFACGAKLDMAAYEPLNAWIKRGGTGEL